MNTYRLRFEVDGRIEGAQQFQAESDAAALTFAALQRRGRAAVLSGAGGFVRSYRQEISSSRGEPEAAR